MVEITGDMPQPVHKNRAKSCGSCFARKGTPLNLQCGSDLLFLIRPNLKDDVPLFCHESRERVVCAGFARANTAMKQNGEIDRCTADQILEQDL
jgi:hypothetical protein